MNKCTVCGYPHAPEKPHDATTIQYQSYFQREHGRLPTHEDAMAHCDEGDKDLMRNVLKAYKIDPRDVADLQWSKKRAG